MASNLRVDSIVPSTSGNVSIGTATGGVTIPGDLGISGTLTYEDVTNVDSVGVITARTDINIGDSIIHIGDTNTKIRFPAADIVTVETGGSERLRVLDSGGITVKNGDDQFSTTFEGGSSGSRNFVSVKAGNTTSGHNSGFRVTHSDGNAVLSMLVNHNDDNANIMNEHQGGALIFHTNESGSVAEKMRIPATGAVTKPLQPGFGASNMNGFTNLSGSIYAVTSYQQVHHNYGNHFNSSNGRFTAPVDGRYLMHAIGMGVNTSSPHIAFGINNSSNGGGPSRGGTDYGNNNMWSHPTNSGYWVCITHILDLSANDYVRVYTYDWNSSNDAPRTFFYGYLLG